MAPTGSARSFDAAFGVALPSRLQVGFVGITGLPSILPWWDAPVDLWGLVGLVPEIGGTVAAAVSNVGVNMRSSEPMPLGASKEYHDARQLISVDLKDLITSADAEGKPKDLATKLWNKIPGSVKSGVTNGIKLAKLLNDSTAAENQAIDLIATGLDVIENAGVLSLGADPSWRVAGDELVVNLRYRVLGRMFSGTLPLTFTRAGEEKTVDIPLPMFVSASDRLEVFVDELGYQFRLFQTMKANAAFSAAAQLQLGEAEKLVRYVRARAAYPENDANRLSVPLGPADGQVLDFKVIPGLQAAQVFFATPGLPVRGTVRAYTPGATAPAAEATEASFATGHSLFLTNLAKNADYRVRLSYTDTGGNTVDHPQELALRTLASSKPKGQFERSALSVGGETMSTPTITAAADSLSVSWTTNGPASTEVYVSPLADFSLYAAAIKHQGGRVSTAYCSSVPGDRELVTAHTITVPGLQPATAYQVFVRSWTFERDDPSRNPEIALGFRGAATTLTPPAPPRVRVRLAGGGNLGGVPVTLQGGGATLVLTTGADGRTPEATLRPGTSYQVSTRGLACLADGASTLSVPAGATGLLPEHLSTLSPRPAAGGRVLDVAGHGLPARLRRLDTNATLNAGSDGRFPLTGAANATVRLEVSHTGFLTATVSGRFDACGQLQLPPVTLTAATASIAARVVRDNGQPVAGAEVRLRNVGEAPTGPSAVTGMTDGQGRVTLSLVQSSAAPRAMIARVGCPGNLVPNETPVLTQAGQSASVELACSDVPPAPSTAPPPAAADPSPPPPTKAKGKGKGKAI